MKKRGAKEKGYKEICCLVCGMLELIEPATTHTWLPLFASFSRRGKSRTFQKPKMGSRGWQRAKLNAVFLLIMFGEAEEASKSLYTICKKGESGGCGVCTDDASQECSIWGQ